MQILIIGFLLFSFITMGFGFGPPSYGYHFLFKVIIANMVYITFYYISTIYFNKKINKKGKIVSYNIISIQFIGMLIFANIFSLMYYIYYYGRIYQPLILLSTLIIAGILLISTIFIIKIQFKKYLKYTILDSDLTRKYYSYSRKVGKNIDIYKSIKDDKIEKLRFTPAFSFSLNKKYNIILSSEFFNNIDNDEKNALILHEIGHFVQYKNERFIKLLISFALLFIVALIGILGIMFSTYSFLFTIIAIISLVALIFLYLLKSNILGYLSKFEITADNFAVQESNNKNALISLLLDSLSYDLFEVDYNPTEIEQIKIHIDERLKKLDYINTFNNDNDYYENHGFK